MAEDLNGTAGRAVDALLSGLLYCGILLCAFSPFVQAEQVVIGVTKLPDDMNLLHSGHEAAWLARRAVGEGLTRFHQSQGSGDPSYRLALSGSLRSSRDSSLWNFRLRPGAVFANGQAVGVSDLRFSLDRCLKEGLLSGVKEIRYQRLKSTYQRGALTVEVSLAAPNPAFPADLTDCLVVEGGSSRLFGADLGLGTNLVATGRYEISDYHAGRQITLRLTRPARFLGGGGPEEVVLRGFDQEPAGLTALRIGTISALFAVTEDVLSKAASDETLALMECEGRRLIRRRSFNFGCNPDLNIAEFKTES